MKSHVYRVSFLNGTLNTRITKIEKDVIGVKVNDSLELLYQVGKKSVRLITKTQDLPDEHKDYILLAVCTYMVPQKIGDPIVKRLQRKLNKNNHI